MANLIGESRGGVAKETIRVFGRKWEWSGRARDHYASEISDRKWALKKRPVIAHIKARSKHSFKTETAWHNYTLRQKKYYNVWGSGKHSKPSFLYGHAEWIDTRKN